MKTKEIAKGLNISDVEVLRLAIQAGIVGASFKTIFSPKQVGDIKEQFAKNSTPQLPPAFATKQVPEAPLEKGVSAIEQVPEAPLGDIEKGIAEIRQTGFSNAMGASESQRAHILEAELQQAADDGLRIGVVTELVRATKQLEGAMLVRDVVFHKGQESRDRFNELLKDSAGDDFLSTSQVSSQTYTQTARTGAATTIDTHQALKNLGINL